MQKLVGFGTKHPPHMGEKILFFFFSFYIVRCSRLPLIGKKKKFHRKPGTCLFGGVLEMGLLLTVASVDSRHH